MPSIQEGNGFSDMRTFPKHEGKKKRPARREHSEMKFLILQGVFILFCGINLRHVERRNLAVWRNGCVDFEMVGFLSTVGKLNFLTC